MIPDPAIHDWEQPQTSGPSATTLQIPRMFIQAEIARSGKSLQQTHKRSSAELPKPIMVQAELEKANPGCALHFLKGGDQIPQSWRASSWPQPGFLNVY